MVRAGIGLSLLDAPRTRLRGKVQPAVAREELCIAADAVPRLPGNLRLQAKRGDHQIV